MSGGIGIQDYPVSIPAGEVRTIAARGQFLRVRESKGSLRIRLSQNQVGPKDGSVTSIVMRKFEKQKLAEEFDAIEIENLESFDQDVVMMIGYGDYEAEILSRTLAAKALSSGAVSVGLGLNTILPENLLRKRVTLYSLDPVASPNDLQVTDGVAAPYELFHVINYTMTVDQIPAAPTDAGLIGYEYHSPTNGNVTKGALVVTDSADLPLWTGSDGSDWSANNKFDDVADGSNGAVGFGRLFKFYDANNDAIYFHFAGGNSANWSYIEITDHIAGHTYYVDVIPAYLSNSTNMIIPVSAFKRTDNDAAWTTAAARLVFAVGEDVDIYAEVHSGFTAYNITPGVPIGLYNDGTNKFLLPPVVIEVTDPITVGIGDTSSISSATVYYLEEAYEAT